MTNMTMGEQLFMLAISQRSGNLSNFRNVDKFNFQSDIYKGKKWYIWGGGNWKKTETCDFFMCLLEELL